MFDAYASAMMKTTDLANWGGIQAQFGPCNEPSCNSVGSLPFSQLGAPPLLYGQAPPLPPFVPFTGGDIPVPPTTADVSDVDIPAVPFGARSLQGTCTGACPSAACGAGFGVCAGLATPIDAAGLNGAGQLVQIVDSGLDTGSPFFFDPALPVVTPSNAAFVPITAHRKVASYWSYADGIDSAIGVGHGTHTAGSLAGSAPSNMLATDAGIITAATGTAPQARLVVADAFCNTPAGCERTGVVPVRPAGTCGFGAACLPTNVAELFSPAVRAGAFISSNSWGTNPASGPFGIYNLNSANIDAFAHNNPDALLVFSSNSPGTGASAVGVSTLSHEAVAKNVLTVGAIADGILAHTAKTLGSAATGNTPLYQAADSRACGGILAYSASLAPALTCPSAPSNPTCFALFVNGSDPSLSAVPGGFPSTGATSQYALGTPNQAELPLCCGCTLQQVVDGCVAAAPAAGSCSATDGTLTGLLQNLQSTYNARFPEVFSSLGPAFDSRNKVREVREERG